MPTTTYPVYDQFGQGLLNTLGSFWRYFSTPMTIA